MSFHVSVNVVWFDLSDKMFQYSLARQLNSAHNKFNNFNFQLAIGLRVTTNNLSVFDRMTSSSWK